METNIELLRKAVSYMAHEQYWEAIFEENNFEHDRNISTKHDTSLITRSTW